MDDPQSRVVFLFLVNKMLKKKRKRRYWVHPLVGHRLLRGAFYTLYEDLQQDESKFFNYFRMSKPNFDELVNILRPNVIRQHTNMREPIPPEEAVAVCLRYLATGCTLQELHYNYRVGRSTAAQLIRRVCIAMWEMLRDAYFPQLNRDEFLKIAAEFEQHANFPHCIGAVDGKHIRIIKSPESGSEYYNYKGYFSIVLMAVADSNYCFRFVDIGLCGKNSDSTIFEATQLWKMIQENRIDIPPPTMMPGTNEVLPYVFVGNEAFGLTLNLLRPYGGKFLSRRKRIFNYRLSRARRYVECAFGILSNKWRIFHRPLNVSVDFAKDIVKAACILHNFVRQRCGVHFEDMLEITGLDDAIDTPREVLAGGRYAQTNRDKFTEFFNSDAGQISWQWEYA